MEKTKENGIFLRPLLKNGLKKEKRKVFSFKLRLDQFEINGTSIEDHLLEINTAKSAKYVTLEERFLDYIKNNPHFRFICKPEVCYDEDYLESTRKIKLNQGFFKNLQKIQRFEKIRSLFDNFVMYPTQKTYLKDFIQRSLSDFRDDFLELQKNFLKKSNKKVNGELVEKLHQIALVLNFVSDYICDFQKNTEKERNINNNVIRIPLFDEEESKKENKLVYFGNFFVLNSNLLPFSICRIEFQKEGTENRRNKVNKSRKGRMNYKLVIEHAMEYSVCPKQEKGF